MGRDGGARSLELTGGASVKMSLEPLRSPATASVKGSWRLYQSSVVGGKVTRLGNRKWVPFLLT